MTSSTRRERLVLVAVALATLLAPLNSTMIAVALPEIVDDFDTSIGTAGWLVTTYLLALAVVQPIAGKLGDRHGRRPFVVGGLAVFGIASLGAALAPSLGFLIGFRVLQAVSGAVVFPNGAGLIREYVPDARRGGAFGIVGGSVSLAAGLGPLLGGAIVTAGGWRAIFLVNVPVVVAALVLAWWSVPRGRPRVAHGAFDWLGSLLLAGVLGGAALLVVEDGHTPRALGAGVALVAALTGLFVWREWRHSDPVVQPRFFRIRAFAAANGAIATSNLAMYTVLLAIPILLTSHLGWSGFESGLGLAALSAPMVVFAPIGGRLADRIGRRAPSVAGCTLQTVALIPLVIDSGLDPEWLLPCLFVMGCGVGLSMAGLQASAVEALEPTQAGVGAGIFSTSRYIGSFAGSIVLARLLDDAAGLSGFQSVFVMALVAAAVSAVVALALPSAPTTRSQVEVAQAPP